MEVIDYIKIAQDKKKPKGEAYKIAVITNFTDDILKKILFGIGVENGLSPTIYSTPYKQYLFELKNKNSKLWKLGADIVFVFFDINVYTSSEFISDKNHYLEVLADIKKFSQNQKGTVVIQTAIKPTNTQHGRILKNDDVNETIKKFNEGLKNLEKEISNIRIHDTEIISHNLGKKTRDLRGLYAFSQPFTSDFFLKLSREWMAYVQTQRGKIYKCIVLDLDNTLWGGVIGEVGPLGVKLGHEYPGNAFREFQRTILDFYNRGIILAINSRNNPGDVDEVFEKNKNMVLKKSHFASIVANWNNKAENLKIIARELNIGLDSLVFIDDDAMNRDLVKTELPQVFVPDWNIPPEEYVERLLDIEAFHSMGLTEEDKERGKMYAAERERKEIVSDSSNLGSYLKTLEVEIDVHLNNPNQIPRLSQLTQKTNQFNLTTERLTENDVVKKIKNGAMFFSGDVKDKFGPYGITVLAIIEKDKKNYKLSNFLMSCRVMGRRVEKAFMSSILKELHKKKINELDARFIVSPKNAPASSFLKDIGGKEVKSSKKETTYKLRTDQKPIKIPIKINKLF